MQRIRGRLVKWNDARGFGFIEVPDLTRQVYLHIKAMRQDTPRPESGNELEFTLGVGRNGGPAAQDAVLADLPGHREVSLRVIGAGALIVVLQTAVVSGRLPFIIEVVYALMGLLSFSLYRSDKLAAAARRWRTREVCLVISDLAFGIIGGLLAQHLYSHKTGKPDFIIVTGLTAALHLALITAIVGGMLTWTSFGEVLMALMRLH